MESQVEASRQALRIDGISHLDIAVEMANNPSDRLSAIEPSQKLEDQQTAASTQGGKRGVREALRARRLKASSIKVEQQEKKEEQYVQCQICTEDCNRNAIKIFGECGHKYCQVCLYKHINSSIKSFKTINCPQQHCRQYLDISSPHIRALKLPQQQKYYKIRVFLNLSKEEDIRICPTENCEGFLKLSDEKLRCPICGISFCGKCQMPRHSGSCDQNGVMFFEDNYEFKRCDKCKMVLERNQGCQHMTCKCGYQFCYLCGVKWVANHKCKPKKSPPAPPRAASDPAQSEVPNLPRVPASAPVPAPAPAPAPVSVPAPAASPVVQLPVSTQAQRSQVNRIQLTLPYNNSPTISVAINSQQRATNLQQNHQDSSLAIDPLNINPKHQTVPPNENCLISALKSIFISLVVLPVHLLTLQLGFLSLYFIIIPILISIFYFFYSFVVGMQTMIQNQSCLKIAILNVFLYCYYVVLCYYRKCYSLFSQEYFIKQRLTLQFLFPISSIIVRTMKNCLS